MKARGPRTEATRAILAFVAQNAPVSHEQLCDKFRPQAACVGQGVGTWLAARTSNLVVAGLIEKGPQGWVALAQVEGAEHQPAPRARTRAGAQKPAQGTSVALPRRVSVMEGHYVPPAPTYRAGAQDHAKSPSMILGSLHTYRSGM